MIEAVNSVISNAQVTRGATSELNAVRSVEVNSAPAPDAVKAPVAPFVSPYISVDLSYDKAVIQIRDSDTGDVVNQFPSEQTLASRQRTQQLQQGVDSSSQRAQQQSVETSSSSQNTTFVASEATSAPSAPRGAGAAQIASAALSSGAQSNAVSVAVISTSA